LFTTEEEQQTKDKIIKIREFMGPLSGSVLVNINTSDGSEKKASITSRSITEENTSVDITMECIFNSNNNKRERYNINLDEPKNQSSLSPS
jgi:hypothetical protein